MGLGLARDLVEPGFGSLWDARVSDGGAYRRGKMAMRGDCTMLMLREAAAVESTGRRRDSVERQPQRRPLDSGIA